MSDDFRRAADNYWRAAEARSWTRGILGKPNGDGTYTVPVADTPGYYWVRVSTEGTQSLTMAKSIGRVAARPNLRVRMKREDNAYVIYDTDAAYNATVTAADPTNNYGTPQHTHRSGTGLDYEVEAKMLEPGRVIPDTTVSAFWVYINPFRYYHVGAWQTWPGGGVSIATEKPTTSSKHAWIVVGIDPDANAAIVVGGAEIDTTTTLTLEMLDDIDIGTMIPCGALQVATADTSVSDYTKYYDAHGWFGQGPGFNDAEGAPADVIDTAADGTSEFAARRDHVHAIDIGMDDLNDAVIVGTPDDYDVLHWNSGGYWGPSDMAFLLKQNTGALYGDFVGWRPLNVAAVPFGGSVGTYPTFWTEATAATYATMAVPNTMWTLQGDTTNNAWRYHGDGDFNIESGVTSDGWLSYWFGPILLKDGLYPTDVEYRLGVYAPSGADTNANIFARIAIQWDASASLWQVRSEQKDGTTQTDGSWVPLARTPLSPFVARVAIRNNATKTARVYIGGGGLHLLHTLLGESDLDSTMGVAKIQFAMARTSGGTEPDDVISIAGIDYSLNP